MFMNRRLNDQGVNFSNLISRFSIILVKACERFLLRMLLTPDSGPDSSVTRGSVPQDYCHCRCQPKRGSLAAPAFVPPAADSGVSAAHPLGLGSSG